MNCVLFAVEQYNPVNKDSIPISSTELPAWRPSPRVTSNCHVAFQPKLYHSAGVFSKGSVYDQDDREADKVWDDVDDAMDQVLHLVKQACVVVYKNITWNFFDRSPC